MRWRIKYATVSMVPLLCCYLVRETKGTKDMNKVRPDERDKIRCGVK